MSTCRSAVGTFATAFLTVCASASESEQHLFRNPTFEELANATVTSVTRAPLRQFTAPAAAYVLTSQDVRASGSRNIPDALRFAPGVQVAQFDAHTWAIAARGFNTLFVDKLLVLIDGRSVYTPLWSGVYWEQHGWLDLDLDRIEVIHGPGGSAWGANAVNGVINILSKPAHETQGLALELGGGTEERAFGGIRYGGALGEDGHYRVYANYQARDDTLLAGGSDAGDAWNIARGGMRYEHTGAGTHFMLKGEAHTGDFDEAKVIASPQAPFLQRAASGSSSGAYLQTAWSRQLTQESELRVDAWWDHYERRLAPSNEESDALKLELQYRTVLGAHSLVSEVGYRRVDHESTASFAFALLPAHRTFDVWSASVQDEITLSPELSLTAGARVEHHDFVDWEWQPNLRLSWQRQEYETLWAAVGRAVRTPSISNEGGLITLNVTPSNTLAPGAPPAVQQIIGNPELEAEELTAWEFGWRHRWPEQGSLQASAFYNDYDELITYTALPVDVTTLSPEFWRIPFLPVNAGSGSAYGVELSALWMPLPDWKLNFELSYLNLRVNPPGDPLADQLSGSSPRWQASVRSVHELWNDWQIAASLRFVDRLDSLGVPSFIGADLRLARQFSGGTEFAIVGRDLWSEHHAEFRSGTYGVNGFVERSVFVTLSWRR